MDKYKKYLKIVTWARRRYTVDGVLVLSIGTAPSTYSKIEIIAAAKYLGV